MSSNDWTNAEALQGSGFVLTEEMDYMASIAGSALSLLLSLFVCAASLWIHLVPAARHHINRVSFRLLLWSMVVEVMYNAVYLYIFSDPVPRMDNPASCAASFYFLVASMGMANWLCTFIGVNLMLAICFGINPVRARLERWYILVSFLLGFGITLVPAIMGHFGPDETYHACYFTETDDALRIRDYIVDLILSGVIAAASVLAVLVTLLRHSRATGRAIFRANGIDLSSRDGTTNTVTSTTSSSPLSPDESASWHLRFFRRRSSTLRTPESSSLHRLEDKFITIALKISLYPLVLIAINTFLTAQDLDYTIRDGIHSQGEYVVYCVFYFLYGGRGIFFACLGLFVDPCLRRGLPAAYRATFPRRPVLSISLTPPDQPHPDKATDGCDPHAESLTDFLSSAPPVDAGSPVWSGEGSARSRSWRGKIWWAPSTPNLGNAEKGETDPAPPDRPRLVYSPASETLTISILTSTSPLPSPTPIPSEPSPQSTFVPAPSQSTPLPQVGGPDLSPPSTSPSAVPPRLADCGRSFSDRNVGSWDRQGGMPSEHQVLSARRGSAAPALGDPESSRRQRRHAAEKMYAKVQAQL